MSARDAWAETDRQPSWAQAQTSTATWIWWVALAMTMTFVDDLTTDDVAKQ